MFVVGIRCCWVMGGWVLLGVLLRRMRRAARRVLNESAGGKWGEERAARTSAVDDGLVGCEVG